MSVSATDNAPVDIDELELTRCVLGRDYVVMIDARITLYRRAIRRVELIGIFDEPGAAFEALDAIDDLSEIIGRIR
ncbi:MAG: hypothetical protein ACYDHH_12400 [Solirubrobacteraceae bacterium]